MARLYRKAPSRFMNSSVPMSTYSPKPIPCLDLAETLFWQIKAACVPGYWEREYMFHETRKWRIDIVNMEKKLAIECEGFGPGASSGRHQRISGMHKDCEKYSELAIAGFRLIRCTGSQIKSGIALAWVERAIK